MKWRSICTAMAVLALAACRTTPLQPIDTVSYVDLERFMGDWYVVASIPTFLERGAHNAVESYELAADGTVQTTFTFRQGGFDGAVKRYEPTGYIQDTESNAVWGMQFIWPIKADYRIVYLNDDYTQTVIGRNQRDYVWIMARSPAIPQADYLRIVALLAEQGYDTAQLQSVPHRWD